MTNYQTNKIEQDEFAIRGVYSVSPTLPFLHEIVKSHLKELAFYLLKLKELGISNEKIKMNILDAVSSIIIGIDYNQEHFSKLMTRLYTDLVQAREMYVSIYQKNNLELEFPESTLKKPPKTNLSIAIRQGQKISTKKSIKKTTEQKNLLELIFDVTKSICVHLVELEELDFKDEQAYEALLSLLNTMNSSTESAQELQKIIEKFVKLDHIIFKNLHEKREARYGTITPTKVSLSTRPNKAILVSGTNLRELEALLEATKGKNIDIYTHGRMLMAHAFPKLKKYSHLIGHFGVGMETYLLDFASFPGAIFMTKHSLQKIEHLYRSKIFTTDIIAPKGVTIIVDNNYEPLIEAANSAKGFTIGREKPPIKINLDEKKFLEKITEIAEKIEKGEIKHFFTIGIPNHTKSQKDYFEKFLHLLNDDSFVLSFSYSNKKDNILLVESEYSFPLLYKSLEILTRKLKITELNPIVLYTRCETHTISNVLYMKHLGIKTIYFADCSPMLINPSIINTMREVYNIKTYTNPQDDLKEMLKE